MLLHACKNRIALDQGRDCGGWSECRFRFHAALLLVTNIVTDVVTDVADNGIPSLSRTAVIVVTAELLSFGLILSIAGLFQIGTEDPRTGVEPGKCLRRNPAYVFPGAAPTSWPSPAFRAFQSEQT